MENTLAQHYKEMQEKTHKKLLIAIGALVEIQFAQWNSNVTKEDASKVADEAIKKILNSK